jgi:hypothetical protein
MSCSRFRLRTQAYGRHLQGLPGFDDPGPLVPRNRRQSAAITAAVIVAGGAAYAANKQANAQKDAAKKGSTTNTTTTQNPYMSDTLNPDINQILALQRAQVAQGAPQVDAHGRVTYSGLPGTAAGTTTSSGSGGGGAPSRTGKATTWTDAHGNLVTTNAAGKVVPATGAATPSTSAGPSTGAAGAPDYMKPNNILSQVAAQGFQAGNTPTVAGARNAMANIWGDAGNAGGTAAGTEQTGFEWYNPILNGLTQILQGNVGQNNGEAADLLRNFLGQGGQGGATGSGGSGSGGGSDGENGWTGGLVPAGSAGAWSGSSYNNQSGGNNNGVPDTMAPSSFFGDQTRKLFDDPTNDADLQTVIDSMNADAARGMYADKAQLDAAAQGSGRLGGDIWKGMSSDAERAADQTMLANSANVRLTDRQQRTAAKLQALGLVNTRDLGLLDANTSTTNAGIAASASAAGNASAAALAQRAQNLSAINSLMQNEQFDIGQLGGVGQQLSGDRLNSLGMVPGLEGIGLSGLNAALGAGNAEVGMRGQDLGLKQAQISAGVARQGLNQQLGMFNASQQQNSVNDYLRTVMGIGSMGATSHAEGTGTSPVGISPTGSALQAGLGAGLAAYGAYNQYANTNTGGGAPYGVVGSNPAGTGAAPGGIW